MLSLLGVAEVQHWSFMELVQHDNAVLSADVSNRCCLPAEPGRRYLCKDELRAQAEAAAEAQPEAATAVMP